MKKITKIVLSVCCIAVATASFFVCQQRNSSRVIISENVEALSQASTDRFQNLGNGVYVDNLTGCMCFDGKSNPDDGEPGCESGGGVCQLWTSQPATWKDVIKAFLDSQYDEIAKTLLDLFVFK